MGASSKFPKMEQNFVNVIKTFAKKGCNQKTYECLKLAAYIRPSALATVLNHGYGFKKWVVQVVSVEDPIVFKISQSPIQLRVEIDQRSVKSDKKLHLGQTVIISGQFVPFTQFYLEVENSSAGKGIITNPIFDIYLFDIHN